MFSQWFADDANTGGESSGSRRATEEAPMPAAEALEAEFGALLEKLDVPAAARTRMAAQSAALKWNLCKRHRAYDEAERMTTAGSSRKSPGHFVELLHTDGVAPAWRTLEALQSALSGAPATWVDLFLAQWGLHGLVGTLGACHRRRAEGGNKPTDEDLDLMSEAISCFKALMNTRTGLAAVVEHPSATTELLGCFHPTTDSPENIAVLELTAVRVCRLRCCCCCCCCCFCLRPSPLLPLRASSQLTTLFCARDAPSLAPLLFGDLRCLPCPPPLATARCCSPSSSTAPRSGRVRGSPRSSRRCGSRWATGASRPPP